MLVEYLAVKDDARVRRYRFKGSPLSAARGNKLAESGDAAVCSLFKLVESQEEYVALLLDETASAEVSAAFQDYLANETEDFST